MISVIIPYMEAFEGKQQILNRCLDSISDADEVIVVENWRDGYAVPINYGLSQAKGDFLIVMNDDIYKTRGALQGLCDPDAVTSPVENGLRPKDIWGNCFCMPRWVYEKTGGMDEGYRISYYDDDDFIYTLKSLGIPMKFIDTVEFANPDGGTTLETFEDRNAFFKENQERFVKKWGKLP